MPAAEFAVERFPAHHFHLRRQTAPRVGWIRIGYEHEIRQMVDLWQRYLYRQVTTRLDLLALPENDGVMWQLYRRLVGNALRQELVRIHDGVVFIDKRELSALREGFDLLGEFLEDDHRKDLYVWDDTAGEDGEGDYVRASDVPPPVVDLQEARAMYEIIDSIETLAADNVVKFREDA